MVKNDGWYVAKENYFIHTNMKRRGYLWITGILRLWVVAY